MGGKVLEYEAKTIKNEGYKQGMTQGMTQGIMKAYIDLINDGIITLKEAASRLHVSEKAILDYKENNNVAAPAKEGGVMEKLESFKQETEKNEQKPKTPVKTKEELQQ